MTPGMEGIAAALAELTDAELQRLMASTLTVPRVSPGLLAWLEAACDWERNRRAGADYELQPPEAAIPPEEDAMSVDAAMLMRMTFSRDGASPAVIALLDAVVDLLAGGSLKH